MARKKFRLHDYKLLSLGVALWLAAPLNAAHAEDAPPQETQRVQTEAVDVEAQAAQEEAKYESQQKTIITKEDIEKKQAKAVEDIIFSETGVSRTVDAMGRVGISIRGAEPRHTLILVDGQPVLGDLAKYSGAADEVMRLGTENVERIEIIQGAASAKYGSDAIGGVVNIITKKAQHEPGVQFNVESMRRADDDHKIPYTNFFLRADSGDMGKFRIGLSGSKREVMPVYASRERKKTGLSSSDLDFEPNALRFYGDTATVGLVGTYDANKNNSFEFRVDHYAEDLSRVIKRTDSELEPQQHFKRKTGRDAYNLGWRGMNKISDWNVEFNYTTIKEDDVSLINYAGKSVYEGKNELRYVDNVDHSQFDLKASANTQLGDKHLLSYGFGYTKESGEGSRLKSSPNISTRHIDPWDYDKSLLVDKKDRLMRGEDTTNYIWSHIHDYAFPKEYTGNPKWLEELEYYNYDEEKNLGYKPKLTYNDFTKYRFQDGKLTEDWYYDLYVGTRKITDIARSNLKADYDELEAKLKDEYKSRHNGAEYPGSNIVGEYFQKGINRADKNAVGTPTLNGKMFLEEYWERDQRITVGSGSIQRYNFFVG
ncbi:TonB-dependent receptor plug domain-containing protein, partial [Selenomonas sp.]|uniref:TonB-dependent receptor plug domain-containing protein n=1 Tax=Selenomonas sp. TaxID=2053611 RepID=UPI003FA2DB5F